MTSMVTDVAPGLSYIDVAYRGTARLIACGVLETPAGLLLVDPGPERSLDTIFAALDRRGQTLSDVAAILLTHIHLDHAGATGTLVTRNRRIRVFVHRRGAPHMIDPSRLLRSAHRIYGDQMDELWGTFAPVPEDCVEVVDDGDVIGPGGREIDVRYTPGHASHHVTYFDRATRTAFVGDTTGMRIRGVEYVAPVTPPPDIDLDVWPRSLDAIRSLEPQRLFLTHFGPVDDAAAHISTFHQRLVEWGHLAREEMARTPNTRAAATAFRRDRLTDIRASMSGEDAALYEQFADPAGSFLGLARYWERNG